MTTNSLRALNDYGCAGIGSLNPFVGNAGKLVDDIDSAINAWKICIRCAMELLTDNSSMDVPKYRYHSIENYCSMWQNFKMKLKMVF